MDDCLFGVLPIELRRAIWTRALTAPFLVTTEHRRNRGRAWRWSLAATCCKWAWGHGALVRVQIVKYLGQCAARERRKEIYLNKEKGARVWLLEWSSTRRDLRYGAFRLRV